MGILMDDALLPNQSARAEAVSLYRLIGRNGETLEGLRELIAVPKGAERLLREYAQAEPAEAYWIDAALRFRKAIAEEFERLVLKSSAETQQTSIEAAADATSCTFCISDPQVGAPGGTLPTGEAAPIASLTANAGLTPNGVRLHGHLRVTCQREVSRIEERRKNGPEARDSTTLPAQRQGTLWVIDR